MTRRLLFGVLLLLMAAMPASAQTPVRVGGIYTPLGYCQITSLASAVALITASCSSGSVPTGATIAEICVEVAGVRYLDTGGTPTGLIGMPVVPASSTLPFCYQYAAGPLSQLQFIAITGSPIIDILFYK